MKLEKYEDIQDRIDSLPNWQLFLCCRTMLVLMDRQLSSQTDSRRPKDVVITDFDQFTLYAGADIQQWCLSLASVQRPTLARLGRFLMTVCLNCGYVQAVISACATAQAPVAHLGDLQPAQIVSALGVVISWLPNGQAIPLPQPEMFNRIPETCSWPSRRTGAPRPLKTDVPQI